MTVVLLVRGWCCCRHGDDARASAAVPPRLPSLTERPLVRTAVTGRSRPVLLRSHVVAGRFFRRLPGDGRIGACATKGSATAPPRIPPGTLLVTARLRPRRARRRWPPRRCERQRPLPPARGPPAPWWWGSRRRLHGRS